MESIIIVLAKKRGLFMCSVSFIYSVVDIGDLFFFFL